MSKKILSLVRNSFTNDARVDKSVNTLIRLGYKVIVVAEKAFVDLPIYEKNVYSIIRVPLFSSLYARMSSKSIDIIEKRNKKNWKNKLYFSIKNIKIRLMLTSFLNTISYNFLTFCVGVFNKPDIIYANDLDTLLVAYLISKFTRAKIIYDSHEIWFYGSVYRSSTKLRQIIWRNTEKILIHKVAVVVMVSPTGADHLKKKYDLDEVFVVRNCSEFQDINSTDILRKEFNILRENKILIYQGLLKKVRGIFDIVNAVKSIENIAVVFMGDGRDKKELFNYINELGLQHRIFIKDPVPYKQILITIASADIGLQPFHYTFNHYVSIPNKLTECIMAGLASIGSNFPEMKKIIEDNEIGFTHDEKNVSQIRDAIDKLVSDEKLLKTCKVNALKIRKQFAWEKDEEVIKSILSKI